MTTAAEHAALPVVAYLIEGGRVFHDAARMRPDSASERNDGSIASPLVRQSDAEAALHSLLAELSELQAAREQDAMAVRIAQGEAAMWKARLDWLLDQHWVEPEATYRLNLGDTDDSCKYKRNATKAIDAAIAAQQEKQG